MALLEVKGITKTFGGLVAVENVEFNVNEGEIVSIIGPNGAGKTTIFNMLTGVPCERRQDPLRRQGDPEQAAP